MSNLTPRLRYQMALPHFPPEDIDPILAEFRKILAGEDLLSMGKNVRAFEEEFARYSGAPYAVATNSCSAALEIALRCIGLKTGDEVIIPAETFIATGSAVLREGGKPVFAEINPETFCLSADDLEKKVTGKTRAVILVHMAGLVTPEITRIQEFLKNRNIILIEDAAHAPGASLNGHKAGTFGEMACFSFYPTKVITTAEGGMLVTGNKKFHQQANGFRNRGLDTTANREIYASLGTNNRMTELAAILGRYQLRRLDEFIEHRNRIAGIYNDSLDDPRCLGFASPLLCPPQARHSYWRYLVRISDRFDRVELQKKMNHVGIALDWAYDPPLHLQPLFREQLGTREGLLPVTEKTMKHFVCLPIHAGIRGEDAKTIASVFKESVESLIA